MTIVCSQIVDRSTIIEEVQIAQSLYFYDC